MDFTLLLHPIFASISVIAMFMLIKWDRIKQLFPIGVLSMVLLLIFQESTISLNLLKYEPDVAMILDIPVFQYIWAFATSILLISFIEEDWLKKVPVIVAFSVYSIILAFIADTFQDIHYLNGFNLFYDLGLTLTVFSFGVWLSEGLFKERIHSKNQIHLN